MRMLRSVTVWAIAGLVAGLGTIAVAQGPPATEPATREAVIAREQAEKAKTLHPFVPSRGELIANRFEGVLAETGRGWHPYLEGAYRGAGFAPGVGYMQAVGPYNRLDLRGSLSIKGYKRIEAEFVAPRLFERRGRLTLLGGWREATQVGFYGTGMATSQDDRVNYGFQRPYASAHLMVAPTRKLLVVGGGVEWSQWSLQEGHGTAPSIETAYTPATLPGVGTKTDYLHTQATVGLDWRTSPGYTRRGGFLGATVHDFHDGDDRFGFQQVDYEAIQHIPILREAWVLSFRALMSTASAKNDQQMPFFMLPSLGGGSNLRGYHSWRFRDKNSLLLQGEWRIMVNRFLDAAFFYDAGRVAARASDLDLDGLKGDFGFGFRFHGPTATPLRIEVARSGERTALIFALSHAF